MLIAAIPLYEKFVFVIRFLKDIIRNGRASSAPIEACNTYVRRSVITSFSRRSGVISVRISAVQSHLSGRQSVSVNPYIDSLQRARKDFGRGDPAKT
jgi:hypothetical protein